MQSPDRFAQETALFEAMLPELMATNAHKWFVAWDGQAKGVFDTYSEASDFAARVPRATDVLVREITQQEIRVPLYFVSAQHPVLGTFVAEFDAPIIKFTIGSPENRALVLPVHGIIDTGANRVCIPHRLAVAAGLRQTGTIDLKTASQTVQGRLFDAQLDFVALGFSEKMQVVSPSIDRADIPILIGMSVLRQFNIWYHGGMGTWSFYRRENG